VLPIKMSCLRPNIDNEYQRAATSWTRLPARRTRQCDIDMAQRSCKRCGRKRHYSSTCALNPLFQDLEQTDVDRNGVELWRHPVTHEEYYKAHGGACYRKRKDTTTAKRAKLEQSTPPTAAKQPEHEQASENTVEPVYNIDAGATADVECLGFGDSPLTALALASQ
jgi:hypothetical protein